ncbi:M16 family metallopeptidase [Spelaeicoccus albus]|uniref:Putative Zn-dependent peptidase n=1 Tax=Spelaeicoccus albus TaxID=1280376 RepID=A0A7Z0D2S5_9MICO|nr:pitrilysin family protein [Spelaeicoccus albus]NYI67802.1 putative Zn-dependent peptidase [Spelaeicoccus albus]
MTDYTTRTLSEEGGGAVRRSVLPGGVRVLSETMPGLLSATIGFWVGVGSRDERSGQLGSTHFLEHLLFKGTKSRSAMDIACAFDAVGGEANAATGKEHTCYYARVLADDLPMAIETIADMVTSAELDGTELNNERGVILEELAMTEDDPADLAHEKFAAAVLGDHPLGRPIGGTPDEITAVARDAVFEHYRNNYVPHEIVIAAAGGLDHDRVCELVHDAFTRAGWQLGEAEEPKVRPRPDQPVIPPTGGAVVVNRPIEQANLLLGCAGLTATSSDRYTMSVLNAVLGGGMSSRLFQEVREKRGLAYATYSFAAGYSDTGYFALYAGCAPSKTLEVTELLVAEWERLATEPVGADELARAVGQLSGGMVLALEDSASRMNKLGVSELVRGEYDDLATVLAAVRAVTAEDVRQLAADLLARPRSISLVGPYENGDADEIVRAAGVQP